VDRQTRLAELREELVTCRACPRLVEWREQVAHEKRAAYAHEEYWGRPVPGFGDADARVLVVGLAPAAHGANRTGRMFTGDRSGDWLFASLHRTGFANQPTSTHRDDGLALTDCWVTSPVKCAPPGNRPTTAERDTCRQWFDREVASLPVEVVVALGGFGWSVALATFGWDTPRKPRFGHGVEAPLPHSDQLPEGATLLGSYHVSQQNTFTGRLTEEMLDAVFARAAGIVGPRPLGE
jgi:uracil-DNA glycosylase family 4